MKRIFLIALIVIGFKAFSQGTIDSIVTTSKLWSRVQQAPPISPPPYRYPPRSNYIKFAEDTIIKEYHFKKIFQSEDSLGLNWVSIGFIREHDNKVYAINKLYGFEILLYDFNVKVNDTLFILPFTAYDSVPELAIFGKVVKIDSIDILSGRKKRIVFDGPDGDTWIEGIGSLNGIMNSFWDPDGVMYDLLCCWDSGILQYSNPNFDECFIVEDSSSSTQSSISNEEFIAVYPNPFNNQVTFKLDGPIQNYPLDLKVFDFNGKIVYTAYIAENTTIDLSTLNSGMYFYSLSCIDWNFHRYGKLIKQ